MASIFLSYSSKDVKIAENIHKFLEQEGIDVWRDKRSIEADWSNEISDTLTKQDIILHKPNCWDYATLLELAVLDKDGSQVSELIDNALKLLPDKWQVESTLGNINVIKEIRKMRNELEDIENMIINKLEAYTAL